MRTDSIYKFGILIACGTMLSACGGSSDDSAGESASGPDLPAVSFDYAVEYPMHFLVPPRGEEGRHVQPAVIDVDNTGSNVTTNTGATLGRVLFYDKNLSIDQTVSCASCHLQSMGFSDAAVVSAGVNGGFTRRHSMGLTNVRFFPSGRAFWDTRAASLEEQALMPIIDPAEMGLPDLAELEQRLAGLEYYPALFEAAFGDTSITSDRVAKALAQFVRSFVSIDSKYDRGRIMQIVGQGLDPVVSFLQPLPNFSSEENRGKEIFITSIFEGGGGCFACHSTEAFANATTGPTSNGLDAATPDDQGACEPPEFQSNLQRCGTFKVPSLRNVAVRPPFMHDGRFPMLADVIDHYSENIQLHPNLAGALIDDDGNPRRFNFSPEDKSALLAFLHTLTDESFLRAEKFSDPFD